ncbi:hypothetical protein T484DRAFT_2024779, partial [Baffinella frigidus]
LDLKGRGHCSLPVSSVPHVWNHSVSGPGSLGWRCKHSGTPAWTSPRPRASTARSRSSSAPCATPPISSVRICPRPSFPPTSRGAGCRRACCPSTPRSRSSRARTRTTGRRGLRGATLRSWASASSTLPCTASQVWSAGSRCSTAWSPTSRLLLTTLTTSEIAGGKQHALSAIFPSNYDW